MAVEKDKGSIIYKLIIVILIAVLLAAILIPKQMWDQEEQHKEQCRHRMSSLLSAELLYQKYHDAYTDTLDSLIHFFSDSLDNYRLEFVAMDSFLCVRLSRFFKKDTFVNAVIDTVTADTSLKDIRKLIEIQGSMAISAIRALREADSAMAAQIAMVLPGIADPHEAAVAAFDSLSKSFSHVDIYRHLVEDDSLTVFVRNYTPDLTMVNYLPKIMQNQVYALKADSIYTEHLDELYTCPTTGKRYHIAVIGSVITYANIFCPLDSIDSLEIANDWYRSTIGGLKVENHGNIVKGEKSWEKLF